MPGKHVKYRLIPSSHRERPEEREEITQADVEKAARRLFNLLLEGHK
jgi:hypothetical protein